MLCRYSKTLHLSVRYNWANTTVVRDTVTIPDFTSSLSYGYHPIAYKKAPATLTIPKGLLLMGIAAYYCCWWC